MHPLVIAAIALAAVVGLSQYKRRTRRFEALTHPGQGVGVFTLFYAEWCPHCQSVKPKFAQLEGRRTIGGRAVEFRMIDVDKHPDIAQEYGVQGYPTFVYEPTEGQRIKYEGPRDVPSILEFVQSRN